MLCSLSLSLSLSPQIAFNGFEELLMMIRSVFYYMYLLLLIVSEIFIVNDRIAISEIIYWELCKCVWMFVVCLDLFSPSLLSMAINVHIFPRIITYVWYYLCRKSNKFGWKRIKKVLLIARNVSRWLCVHRFRLCKQINMEHAYINQEIKTKTHSVSLWACLFVSVLLPEVCVSLSVCVWESERTTFKFN